jgi:hypothetical protein
MMRERPATISHTRDCVDPWKMVMLKANGDVSLCCWGESVGSIHREELAAIVSGERARATRARLLSGELGRDCLECPARGWTTPSALRDRLEPMLDAERELRALRQHAATLERENRALHRHAVALERERRDLQERTRALDAELTMLATGLVGWWRRATGPIKKRLVEAGFVRGRSSAANVPKE